MKKAKKVKLPVPHGVELPPEIVCVPEPIEHAKVEPLPEASGPIRCILTTIPGWTGDYVVLTATEGHTLPHVSENGQFADVQFSPPTN